MKHYLRLLAGFIGLLVLCFTQLGATAHAGISSAILRVNLTVTAAAPSVPVTVNGSFTYGVTCVGVVPPQFVLTFPPPAFTIPTNAVTPIANSASVSTGAQVIGSNNCTFTQLTRPAPPTGYQWRGTPPDVTINNIVLTDPATIYPAAFANVAALPTVTAVVAPVGGGTVTCTQPTTPLATSTCTATANPGFTFNTFLTSNPPNCPQSFSNPYTTPPLNADCTVTAAFTPDPFVVTAVANPPAGGTISCTSPITFGNSSNCTVTANSGYVYTGYTTSSCGLPGTGSPFSTRVLTSNCTVTANFSPSFVVTGVANPAIGGTVSCASPVASGATTTCTATANTGYSFSSFVFTTGGCGAGSTTPGTFITTAVTANCTVTAAFTQDPLTVTSVANPPAGGTVSCASPVNSGATSSCTATANSGYSFTGFTTSGCGAASAANPFVTAPITANCTVTGAFSLNTYTVTAVANPVAGGAVTCTSPVNSGATSSCTATANSGYSFTGFTTSGCGAASAANPFVTAPITANCTVTGAFSLNTYPVTTATNPAAGGTAICTPNPVPSGSTTSCSATANSGYTFTGFTTSNCGAGSASNPFVTNAITGACTVTAAFSLNAIPVTTAVNLAAGGSITCSPNPVVIGRTATCSVVTNAGYALTGVSGCGGTTTTPGTFVTAPITAACSVAAAFAPFAITPSVPVPTLNGWMLILLTMLVVAIGGAICARRLS